MQEVCGRTYDIITPANMEDVEVKSWFDVKQGEPCLSMPMIFGWHGAFQVPQKGRKCSLT